MIDAHDIFDQVNDFKVNSGFSWVHVVNHERWL